MGSIIRGDIAAPFFNIFGEELITIDSFVQNKEYIDDLFIPLLEKRNVVGLQWVHKVISHPKYQLHTEPLEPVINFEIQIRKALASNLSEEASGIIKSLESFYGDQAYFVFDKDQTFPAYALRPNNLENDTADLSIMKDGSYKRFLKVRYDNLQKSPGTYHYKR